MSRTPQDDFEDSLPAPIDRDDFDSEEVYEDFMYLLELKATEDSLRGAL